MIVTEREAVLEYGDKFDAKPQMGSLSELREVENGRKRK